MKTRLNCPCGEYITAPDEAEHPGRTYGRDEILFMAS
jgi:hypothetical protein